MTLGPNEALIGKAYAAELQTPALLLDLDAFEANVKAMADIVARHGKKASPARQGAQVHAHRAASDRGRRDRPLLRHGARGGERWRPRGSTAFSSRRRSSRRAMVKRLVAAREKIDDLIVAVDSEAGIDALAKLADAE